MGLFRGQLANVVEWKEDRDDVIFYKWNNDEIKKGSRLIIRAGQDAIFMYNGKIEGIFTDEGSFDIESQIIPFLSTLKGFKFGFNSGIRAEVLFINTKEFIEKWGTRNAINLQAPGLPGGMPVRAFGSFTFKVSDYQALIDKVAGIKQLYTVGDVKERVIAVLDQLILKWISKEGKDIFNLQASSYDISRGIKQDLDMELTKIGISVTDFNIQSVSYPEEVTKMQQKAAAQSMISDVNKYQQMAMAESIEKGGSSTGGNMAASMASMQMGMAMGQQMVNQMNQNNSPSHGNNAQANTGMKFCPECGSALAPGAKFCQNCGYKIIM